MRSQSGFGTLAWYPGFDAINGVHSGKVPGSMLAPEGG